MAAHLRRRHRRAAVDARNGYLSAVWTLPKVVFRFVPSPFTTAIIATAIPAAMSPYSMAVAPDSSLTKRLRRFDITSTYLTFVKDGYLAEVKGCPVILPGERSALAGQGPRHQERAHAVVAHGGERHRRPSIALGSTFGRRVVAGSDARQQRRKRPAVSPGVLDR